MSDSLKFSNYHRHSHYTNVRISDSVVRNEDYVKRALELGHGLLSSCEHGFQGNYKEVIDLAHANGLKPLVSAEAYWVKDRKEKDRSNCHIFIGALNEHGRQELNDVLSEANLTGFYGVPRVDPELLLTLPADDIIVTTACIAYWKYPDVDDITALLADHFKKHFYLEVQYHNTEAQANLNKHILALHDKLKVPLIMGCDSHYIYSDKQPQMRTDFLKSKGIDYPEEHGWYLDYPDGQTAYDRFAKQCVLTHSQIIDAISNTNVFLDEVQEYDSPVFNDDIKLPSLHEDWTQDQKNEEYKRLVWQGWDRYKKDVPEEEWPKYETEIGKEIQTVVDTNMADYFMIDYAVMKRGKELGGKLTKSGRGCFLGHVRIPTSRGYKPISAVRKGDHVFDCRAQLREVEDVFEYEVEEELVEIAYENDNQDYPLICTKDHQFLAVRNKEQVWLQACDLREGDKLFAPTYQSKYSLMYHGTLSAAKRKESFRLLRFLGRYKLPIEKRKVYDLSVEGTHTYIVNDIAVHNSGASFFTNTLLGFSDIDRISADVHMYPERFMSTTRILQSKGIPD